jgi:hypothetical protein
MCSAVGNKIVMLPLCLVITKDRVQMSAFILIKTAILNISRHQINIKHSNISTHIVQRLMLKAFSEFQPSHIFKQSPSIYNQWKSAYS